MRTTLDLVIVNWNTGSLLSRALASIECARPPETEINLIVVDNDSADDSIQLARSVCPGADIVQNRSNLGFAAACNQGARERSGEFILFMNPDVELTDGSLSAPLDLLHSDTGGRFAICGIRLLDGDGELGGTCARFPSPARLIGWSIGLDRLMPQRFPPLFLTASELAMSGPVDQVIGAFFLVRRSVFQELDGFDERFFMYYEEVDFSYRAARIGYESYYLADAHAVHRAGGSSSAIPARRLSYSWESRIKYAFKHFRRPAAFGVLVAALLVEPVTRSVNSLAHGSLRGVGETARASMMLWASLASQARQRVPGPVVDNGRRVEP